MLLLKYFRNLKIRRKLILGFTLVILMTLLTGYFGYMGISNINYQNKIGELANRILVDAQDAQAHALNYIIYDDDSFHSSMEAEMVNVLNQASEAQNLMKYEMNKENTKALIQLARNYLENNNTYWEINTKLRNSGAVRVDKAGIIVNGINEVIDAAIGFSYTTVIAASGRDYLEKSSVERIFLTEKILASIDAFRITAQKYQLAVDPAVQDSFALAWMQQISEVRVLLNQALPLMQSGRTAEAIVNVLTALDDYEQQVLSFRELNRELRDLQAEQSLIAREVMAKARSVRDGVDNAIAKATNQGIMMILIFAGLSVLISVLAAVIITRSIVRPVNRARLAVEKMASGNLDIAIKLNQKDEIGQMSQSLKAFVSQLREIIEAVQTASGHVAEGSRQVAVSSQETSEGSNEQASATEEISASLEEMSANIDSNSDNARETEKIALKVAADADESGKAVAESVNAIEEIAERISVIDEIARSTNMLALNAAIEAARAGEAGKGFTVVASEVRKLAEKSQTSAREIMELSSVTMETAKKAGDMLIKLVPEIRKTAELVSEITTASNEQSAGLQQINNAMNSLDTVTQKNASGSEELASVSEQMKSQAEEMQRFLEFFKLSQSYDEAEETESRHLRGGEISLVAQIS